MVETNSHDSVREWNLLLSALNRPQTAAYYEEADLIRQAATLLWGLVENHPFHDGNKRTAWITAEAFLRVNRHRVTATDDEIFVIVVGIAQGLPLDEAEGWLRQHVITLP